MPLRRLRVGRLAALLRVLLCAAATAATAAAAASSSSSNRTGCYAALFQADSNGDGKVNSSEYITFLKLYEPGVLSNSVNSFAELPLSLQGNFYTLACACRNDPSQPADCCIGDNANLPDAGTGPNQTPTAAQQTRLQTICVLTASTLTRLTVPTGPPRTTSPPTSMPTTAAHISVSVSYTIVLPSEALQQNTSQYESELVAAMNDLSVQVAQELAPHQNRPHYHHRHQRILLRRRRLQGAIHVQLPTTIASVTDAGGFTMTPVTNSRGIYTGDGPCPADLGDPSIDSCERVVADMELVLSPIEENLTRQNFQTALETAILQGSLEQTLLKVRPLSIVTVVSGQATRFTQTTAPTETPNNGTAGGGGIPRGPPINQNNTRITAGGTVGIVVGSFALVGLVSFLFVRRHTSADDKNNNDDKEKQLAPVEEGNLEPLAEAAFIPEKELDLSESSVGAISLSHENISSKEMLNSGGEKAKASTSKLPSGPKLDMDPESAKETDQYSIPEPEEEPGSESPPTNVEDSDSPAKIVSSEDASESGWSSNDGYTSSAGTQDEDDNDSLYGDGGEGMFSTKMIDLQAIEANLQNKKGGDNDPPGVSNLADLEAAIMVGDWAAVGSSAAALASGNYDSESREDQSTDAASSHMSDTFTEEWRSRDTAGSSWQRATDTNKAAELDKLIEQGDWEAVIQAAAKFEAEQQGGRGDSIRDYDPSQTTGDGSYIVDEDGTTLQTEDGNVSMEPVSTSVQVPTNVSSSSDTNESAKDTRSIVMELLQKVVPEEIGNVDEMLAQFEGREEDLIETLKAMEIRHQARQSPSREKDDESSDKTKP